MSSFLDLEPIDVEAEANHDDPRSPRRGREPIRGDDVQEEEDVPGAGPIQRGRLRFNGKLFFLTYPRDETDKGVRLEQLVERLLPYGPHIRCASEEHGDGGKHLHVFVKLDRRLQVRETRYFDFDGHHPNVQSVRSPSNVFEYVSKDGDFIDHGHPQPSDKRKWSHLVDCSDADSFWETVQAVSPRDYVLAHERLEYFVNKRYKPEVRVYEPHPVWRWDTTPYPDVAAWEAQRLDPGTCKFLFSVLYLY